MRSWFVVRKMTIPRLELGISRVSGERVSHCTIQSCFGFQIYSLDSLDWLLFDRR